MRPELIRGNTVTYELAQIFITFLAELISLNEKLTSKYGKRIVLIFYAHCIKIEE